MEINWAKEIKNRFNAFNEKVRVVNKVFEDMVNDLMNIGVQAKFTEEKLLKVGKPVWFLQIGDKVEEFSSEDLSLGKNEWWKDEKKLEEKIQNKVLERFEWEI